MTGLIQAVQKPAFDKLGAFDLETFFPAKDRLKLAMQINNLIASPGFATWMQGEPLDAQRLLFTPEGKPRISIISIAHLNDAERMFIVTLVLNEVIAWMRNQSGTGSLRAILYMDEIFGFFPPTANPPSKQPMLTLLKQARAFGLGVVLATQNPVDLDYKGLANCGTWFIGRLQTERDKLRVIEGLKSALAGARRRRGSRSADVEPHAARVPHAQRARRRAGAHEDALGAVLSARPAHGAGDRARHGAAQGRERAGRGALATRLPLPRPHGCRTASGGRRGHSRIFPEPDEGLRRRCSTSPWSPDSPSCTSWIRNSRSTSGRRPDGLRRSMTVPAMPPGKMPATMRSSSRAWPPHPRKAPSTANCRDPRCAPRATPPGRKDCSLIFTRQRAPICSGVRRSRRPRRLASPKEISARASRSPRARNATPQWPSCASAGRRSCSSSRTRSAAARSAASASRASFRSRRSTPRCPSAARSSAPC